jgi:diguanylate cyclase (GGDEF)-like protein
VQVLPLRFVSYALLCLFTVAMIQAQDAKRLSAMLDTAEQMRKIDKPKSRQMLDEVHRALGANPDPLLVARAQFLECTWTDDPATAHRAFAIGFAAAERAANAGLRAKLLTCDGFALLVEGKRTAAEHDFASAADLARQAKDEVTVADSLANIGSLQYNRGAMADALTNLQAAYRMNERLGREPQRLDALTMIANVYADPQVGQYDKAIEYYRQLMSEYEKKGKPSDVADTLFNIGATFEMKGNFAAAEFNYRRALEAFEKLGQASDTAFTKRALGSSIMKQGRAREALPLLDAAIAYYEEKNNVDSLAAAKQSRGMAYRRLGRFHEALQELSAARRFFESENNARFLEKNVEEVALIQAKLGNWREAYEAGRRHATLQQSLAASRRDELSSRLRIEFDAEKKEQENRALARENALRATALREAERNQKLQFVVIALTALLAMALAILFWRQVVNTRRMRSMALTDELTRLPNRRHILTLVEIAFAAAKRDQRPTALIVFDIDRFKRINDTYGHAAGDQILQRVASTCRFELRPSDQVGRIGGEEFLVVLHDATASQANEIAERLRSAVEHIDFSGVAEGLRVTISLGVWVANEYAPSIAIAAADSLLYRAKETGRNRVVMDVA